MEAGTEIEPLLYEEETNTKNEPSQTCTYLCCLVALLVSTTHGMMLGISSPLIPDIQQDKQNNTPHLTNTESSWFVGVMALGAIVGGFMGGYIMQSIGRKITISLTALPLIIGLSITGFAIHLWMLYLGRIIIGVGVGMSTLIVPIYIGEISPSKTRGKILSMITLSYSFGILLIFGIGIVLPWRWLCAAATVPPLLLLLLSMFIVETPRYFMLKNNKEKVKSSLQRLRGANANIEEEYKELEASIQNEVKQATWVEIITEKALRTPTLLMLALVSFQQTTGVSCVVFYAKTLFSIAGFSTSNDLALALLSIPGTLLLSSFLASMIIDKVGRKVLLITSGVLMTVSLSIFGLYFSLISSQDSPATTASTLMSHILVDVNTTLAPPTASSNHKGPALIWMALVSVMVCVAAFAFGLGPAQKAYFGEIFPLRARGKAAGLTAAFTYICVFVVASCFSYMLKYLTPQGTFWFFAANAAILVLFTIFCLPETKGKSLEEIERYFQS